MASGLSSAAAALAASSSSGPTKTTAADAKPRHVAEKWLDDSSAVPQVVHLFDGSWASLGAYDPAWTVEKMLEVAATAVGVGEGGARYLALHGASGKSVDDDRLEPTARLGEAWRRRRQGIPGCSSAFADAFGDGERLILAVRLWSAGLVRATKTDRGLQSIAGAQARAHVRQGRWQCPAADAVLVAAVQLFDEARLAPATQVVRERLGNVLPASVLVGRPREAWELDILVELGFRLEDPAAKADADLLSVLEQWRSFGAVRVGTCFLASPPRLILDDGESIKSGPTEVEVSAKGLEVGEVLLPLRALERWTCCQSDELVVEVCRQGSRVGARCKLTELAAAMRCCSLLDDYATLDWLEEPPAQLCARPRLAGSVDTTSELYASLVRAIVRPPRSIYDIRCLGPSSFVLGGIRVHRRDLAVRNARGLTLECSHWIPSDYDAPFAPKRPCIIFVHANSAGRIQALHYATLVLSLGATLLAFDCAGSGLSEGDTVSLGWREASDLRCVVRYVRTLGTVSSCSAWGCSMGAAAIIFYMAGAGEASERPLEAPRKGTSSLQRGGRAQYDDDYNDHHDMSAPTAQMSRDTFDCVVLDSPYADIRALALDLAASRFVAGFSIPHLVAQAMLHFLRSTIMSTTKLDIDQLKPLDHVHNCNPPALFLHADKDDLIRPHHVDDLVANYGGPRILAVVDGTHSSPRAQRALNFVKIFLAKHFHCDKLHSNQPPHTSSPYNIGSHLHTRCTTHSSTTTTTTGSRPLSPLGPGTDIDLAALPFLADRPPHFQTRLPSQHFNKKPPISRH